MESGSEVLSPIIFLLGSPGFALLLEVAASKGLCLQRDVLPWCHRAGSSDFAEQRCFSKNRLSQRT